MSAIKFQKIFRIGALLSIVAALILGLYIFILKPNIHTIIPGEYYRSAQLNGSQLEQVIKKYHIHSIVNLRVPDYRKNWYWDEVKVAHQLNVFHYDLGIHGYSIPNAYQLQSLVKILQKVELPALIHCHGGADRTGLASAIIIILNNGSLEKAKAQISWKYLAISPKSVGRQVIPLYEAWLKKKKLTHSKQNFLNWVGGLT